MARLISQLLDPLVIVWFALIVITVFNIWKQQIRWAAVSGLFVLMIFAVGSTPLPNDLLGDLEQPFFRGSFKDIPVCDAVVILGGALQKHGGIEEPLGFDASESADRFLTGIELLKRGKAGNLVLGGGSFGANKDKQSEGRALSLWMKRWQLTDAGVYQLGVCANTREEAMRVASMKREYKWARLILVTSAAHMRRAEAVFVSSGVEVIPVACDFQGYPQRGSFFERWRIFPSTGRFKDMKNYLHETVGWLYYRSRGWIKPATDE